MENTAQILQAELGSEVFATFKMIAISLIISLIVVIIPGIVLFFLIRFR